MAPMILPALNFLIVSSIYRNFCWWSIYLAGPSAHSYLLMHYPHSLDPSKPFVTRGLVLSIRQHAEISW